jgi:HK97 family phage prohead protease
MFIRTKSGNYQANNTNTLLEFLGVKKESTGIHKVESDVELIASVPFGIKNEKLEMSKGIPWTLSTFDLDRMGERIDPLGWDFKQYVKNPIVEWSHRYDIPAIGKIDNLTIDENGLHGLIVFNDKEYDPFAWSIEQRIKAGVLRAGSVGFRALEIEIPSKADSQDGTYLIFRKQELLEFSICNVPANPFALMQKNEMNKTETIQDLSHPNFWGGLIQSF